MPNKLHEITGAMIQFESMLDDPEIDEARMLEAIDVMDMALKEKATGIVMVVQNLEATATAMKDAEQRMADRRRVIENRVKSIKTYVLLNMQAAGINKIECPEFKISVRNNPPKIVITDEAAIPLAYLRQPEPPAPMPDKKAILADIKQGVVIDGCHMEIGQSLVIT